MDIKVGDKVTAKKQHPCGGSDFEVLRIGADFKIKCARCGHVILITRQKLEKNIKCVVSGEKDVR